MKNANKIITLFLISIIIFSLTSCKQDDKNTTKTNDIITWNEITKKGVDEQLLMTNINQEKLEYIAKELQTITTILVEKGNKDKSYWQTAQWYNDVKNSIQYQNVIKLNNVALKPLYLIIYKSPNQGLYEYICALAFTDVYGGDFAKEVSWSTSKEFLKLFNQKILNNQTS
ncbi:MAG: hypothetical protein SPI53_03600 [Erysipelotrichaceae bacterium]|nr:hypothetical protein [Erysipelotrichaceae bacterium]